MYQERNKPILLPKTLQSVADIPDFPFATFEEFAAAVRDERTAVWTQFHFRVFLTLSSWLERILVLVALSSGVWVAVAFAIAAFVTGQGLLVVGVVTALLGAWTASPNFNLINGCLPFVTTFAGFPAALITGKPILVVTGYASIGTWLVTGLGYVFASLQVRGAMLESETMLLWLCEQGAVGKVYKIEAPEPDPAVWPPPPLSPE
ncbi:MAG: hypothetical protein ABIY70_17895 [Capsulimonas sp.]|uniref:hypothetical protein n=1 Tax=Capsulimonas sp. TaxID=2494211 RepID=UPI003264BDC2